MFFKRLELHGFKSFGHKTTVDFMPGFTIVVGPNGCGKSNVLDGIRWVLGETSAKSLRGGRMGDVVFRGSSSMKPAGLANVTLTLDNSRGILKIDQSEVSVTRRLFANGDSEYMINKVPCRMRDIHELFLDTGLGADGYSIIEQGQIGQMVAAKPNERRDIFEEAAGISRYKLRREETVRKLARTEEDLLRLQDLVSEVERQCNSLRYQARKADRHRRLTRRLHRLQQRLLVLRHKMLTEQFEQAEQRRIAAEAAFQEAAAKAAQAEATVTTEQQKLEQLQNELQKLQQKRFDMRNKLDREKHRVEMANQQIRNVDERAAAIKKELESRESRLTVMRGTLEALEHDFAQEEKTLAASSAELRAKVEELEATRRQNDAATREINELRAQLRDLKNRENTLQNDKRVAETILERLKDEMGATEFQLKDIADQIAVIDAEIEKHRARAEELRAQLQAKREEARRVQEEIGRDDRAKKELGDRLNLLTRDLNQATSRLQALVELEESYEGYFRGVKEVMRAASRNELSGIIGVVSSLITVPKEYEIAAEVTLGSDVQDIVTERADQAMQAINYLKVRNIGRITCIPLDLIHSEFSVRHLESIWGKPGILGLARDLVTFDPKLQPAVNYLFGNTVFVENLDVAIALERQGIRNRFVSLQGDVINPRGVLSGGSHQTRGLLSRQREIRQLQDRVKTLEGDLARLQQEMTATKDRLGNLYGRAAQLQSDIHQLEKDEASAAKDLQQSERDRKEKRNQQASVEARATQQRMDQVRQAEIIEKSAAGLQELSTNIEKIAATLQEREASSSTLMAHQQELSEAVAVARESQNNLQQRVNSMRARLQEITQGIEEAKADQQARSQELEGLNSDREQALLDREDAEQGLNNLSRAFEEADHQANDKSAEIEAQSVKMRELTSEAQRMQRDRNEKDNLLREVQVHVAEVRAQVEYLEREAEDEFALTMDEIKKELAEAEEADRAWREQQEAAKEAAKAAAKQARKEHKEEKKEEEKEESEHAGNGSQAPAQPVAEKAADEEDDSELGAFAPATTPEDDAITDPSQLRALVTDLRQKLQKMGAVNEAAIEEYQKQSERLTFLTSQRDDMAEAKAQLVDAIAKIDETTKTLFNDALTAIRENFKAMFTRLFRGGDADLILVEDEKYPEPGIDIYAQPPGKKIGGSITLMSGGEKALTAIALMFSLFQYRPSPICILDEIDAPLDDVNVARLCEALRAFARDTQVLIITHNKITMSLADTIYGVTMQEPGVSKVVSVKFDEVEKEGLLETAASS